MTLLAILAAWLAGRRDSATEFDNADALFDTYAALSEAERDQLRAQADVLAERTPLLSPVMADLKSSVAAGRYFALFPELPIDLANDVYGLSYTNDGLEWDDSDRTFSTDEILAQLAKLESWLIQVRDAAALPKADLRLSSGYRSASTRLGDPRRNMQAFRRVGRLLRADSLRRWGAGDRRGAMEWQAARLGIVGHLCEQDSNFVSRLVANYELKRVADDLKCLVHSEGDRQLAREVIGPALVRLEAADPVGLRSYWHAYTEYMLRFAGEQLQGDEVGIPLACDLATTNSATRFVAALFSQVFKPDSTPSATPRSAVQSAARIALKGLFSEDGLELDVASLRAALQDARSVHEEAVRTWDGPSNGPALAEFAWSPTDDPTGLILTVVFAPDRVHGEWEESCTAYATIRGLFQESAPD